MQIGGGILRPRVTSQLGKDISGVLMSLIVLVGAVALTAGGVVVVLGRLRSRQWDEAACHVTRCPSCDQKVRYFARNAGSAGLCPRCLKRLTLPTTPQPLPRAQQPHRVGERLGALRRVH